MATNVERYSASMKKDPRKRRAFGILLTISICLGAFAYWLWHLAYLNSPPQKPDNSYFGYALFSSIGAVLMCLAAILQFTESPPLQLYKPAMTYGVVLCGVCRARPSKANWSSVDAYAKCGKCGHRSYVGSWPA